ncbi:MAG: hypothetical protein F2763_07725 [Actinobacteria bacterium]|uniref:Unannotated protein n=1 Tax=freshwater metagenome TaxID=449393 RepID=A0A6J7APZ4_9ZZZZ|nr:hypothetical protein [Actinomycetota bacterium]
MTTNNQLNEPLQPILVMMSYRGGERLQRCLDSIAIAEHHFKRIVLSITAAEDSDDMRMATDFQQQHPKAEVICTKVELPTMAHQAFWIDYLERTGATENDWIYWLAYDDQVRTRGIGNLVDENGNWPLTRGTAYFGPWAMRHEQADQIWSGNPAAALESWTSFPLGGPLKLAVAEWVEFQLRQPTYMQMSGSVAALANHQQLIHSFPKKTGPMRIEMATAASPNNYKVEEFPEPISIIYGRPNSDRSSYGKAARKQDIHLFAALSRYLAYHPSALVPLTRTVAHVTIGHLRALSRRQSVSPEKWEVRGTVDP